MAEAVSTKPGRGAIRRLATARLISLLGSMAAFNALAFMIFHRTGESSAWVSVMLLVTFGAQGLFSPVAGALGDRFDRRRLWICSEVAAAVGWLGLALARTSAQMVVMAFVTATLESPIWPVSGAVVPNLVDDEDLSWANATLAVGRNIGNLFGPILGGVLVAALAPGTTEAQLRLAGYVVFGLNAVSFLVAAWLIWSVRAPFSSQREGGGEHAGIRAGFVFMVRDRVLRSLTLAWVVLLLGAGFVLIAEVSLADVFRTGSIGYGLLQASWGAGSLLGSLVGRRFLTREREPWGLVVGVVGVALGIGLVSIVPFFVLALVLTVLSGSGEGLSGVAEQGIIQRRTPDEVRARVMGATEAAVMMAFAASFTFGGALVDAVGVRWSYALAGMSCMVAASVLVPAMRLVAQESRSSS